MATALPLINYTTVHIREDSTMEAPEEWTTGEYVGFRVGGFSHGTLTVWVDWEAIPRLCHLLTELYARRPGQQQPAPHTLAGYHCAFCNVEQGQPHIFGCPVLSLAEDR